MTDLYVEPVEDIVAVQKRISDSASKHINLFIPATSPLARVTSLKIIRTAALNEGKEVIFYSDDPAVQTMIATIQKPPQDNTFIIGKDVAEDEEDEADDKEVNIPTPVGNVRLRPLTRQDKKKIKLFASSRGVFFIGALIITIIIGIISVNLLYKKLHQAEISIVLKKQSINKSYDVTATTKTSVVDVGMQRIPAQVVESTETSSMTVKATGKQFVGDKAKGEITIYNKTDSDAEFPRGAMVTRIGTNNEDYVYYLDEAVEVPKRKQTSVEEGGGSQQTTVFGKEKVAVTAAEIGEEYNLKKGEKFIISDYSTTLYTAENEEALSGGNKREAVAVTQADLDKLLAELTPQITEKAKTALKNTSQSQNVNLSENTITTSVLQTVYDKKVGDVSDEVTLTMQMKASDYSYREEDLRTLVEKLLNSDVNENLELTKDNNIEIENVRMEADDLKFVAKVTDNVIVRVDMDKLKESFAGKKVSAVEQYLTNQSNFTSFVIVVTPKLPFRVQTIPRDYSKIKINVDKSAPSN